MCSPGVVVRQKQKLSPRQALGEPIVMRMLCVCPLTLQPVDNDIETANYRLLGRITQMDIWRVQFVVAFFLIVFVGSALASRWITQCLV